MGEAEESFGAGQKGSSAMPHKRNPILSERLCGLARVLRGYAGAGLEDVALWHERDISHSSVERVVLPDASLLACYVLRKARDLVAGLVVPTRTGRSATCWMARGGWCSASRCSWRWSSPVSPGTRPTASFGTATPGWHGSKDGHSARCWRPTKRSGSRPSGSTRLFDLRRTLRHTGRFIDALGSLAAGAPATWRPAGAPATWRRAGAPAVSAGRAPAAPRLVHRGKVRELYEAGDGLLLMVASDRISAFDVVMTELIPDKGRVLTAMTAFWCEELADLAPGSLVTADPDEIAARVPAAVALGDLAGRSMLVRQAEMLPLECIVRGYLAGQAYQEYSSRGTVHGTPMSPGLRLADRLPQPMFTPSTKAAVGHDENITFEAAAELVGRERATEAHDLCLALFERGAARATAAGFVLADTKFELGLVDGRLSLCDEVVTPDSSRLWPADQVVPGTAPPAFDKQPLRDWAEAQDWDKSPPPPPLPPEVVAATSKRYTEAYERVTGRRLLLDWYGARR